jgi:transcriptional activator SPT8
LNTGQTVRTYPTHGAQLSSIALRPFSHPLSPSPSPKPDAEKEAPKEKISVSVGPDFFEKRQPEANAEPNGVAEKDGPDSSSDTIDAPAEDNVPAAEAGIEVKPVVNDDIDMDKASSHDSLFDEDLDVDGETAPASNDITIAPTPSPHPTITATGSAQKSPLKPTPLNLALPGMQKPGVESKTGSSSNPGVPSSGRAGAASNIPLLSKTSYKQFSEDVILYSSMDGQVVLIDRRVPSYGGASGVGVGRLMPGEKAPPWCMSVSQLLAWSILNKLLIFQACWSGDGNQVLAGRRNGTVDIWDVRRSSTSSAPNLLRTLKTPAESGPVSCVVALPDGQHVAT